MKLLFIFFFLLSVNAFAQKNYTDSMNQYQKDYVQQHEVVKGKDKEAMHFFKVDKDYKVIARFEKKENSPWFMMESSGPIKKMYRIFGTVYFTIKDTALQLNIYQSQSLMEAEKYKDYLFVPFTDATNGAQTYYGGRYIDLTIADIKNNLVSIDFNKAYNPYCAYVSGVYNCPIPPKENYLAIAIEAGEKAFNKPH